METLRCCVYHETPKCCYKNLILSELKLRKTFLPWCNTRQRTGGDLEVLCILWNTEIEGKNGRNSTITQWENAGSLYYHENEDTPNLPQEEHVHVPKQYCCSPPSPTQGISLLISLGHIICSKLQIILNMQIVFMLTYCTPRIIVPTKAVMLYKSQIN